MRLGVSPTTTTTTDFYSQRFEALFLCSGTLNCSVCLAPQLLLPVHPHANVGLPVLPALPYHLSSQPQLPVLAPPTHLDKCFFFNSLVVGLPYSSILCQFWGFLFLNLFLSFFWLCEEATGIYLCLHLGWKFHSSRHFEFLMHFVLCALLSLLSRDLSVTGEETEA